MSFGHRSRQEQRRLLLAATVRVLVITTAVVAAYFLLPLDALSAFHIALTLVLGLLLLGLVTAAQLRAVLRSTRPGARAVEALAATIPLFILLFAAVYYVLADAEPQSFSEHPLTRLDTMYFAVTVFATVGFGDISATSQLARGMVTVQMVVNLLVVGAVVQLFLGAVKSAQGRGPTPGEIGPPQRPPATRG
jgi:hypothetical protein